MYVELPKTQKALKVSADATKLELTTAAVPILSTLQAGEILLKVHAAGINHVENYFFDRNWARPGDTFGTTMGGDVLAIGPGVTRFAVGDTIGAFVFHADRNYPERGGFQEYAIALECNAINVDLKASELDYIPAGPITTFESAASALGNIVTIGASIYYAFDAASGETNKTILVYGAGTGIGQLAVQYCHLIGWRVIATASIQHAGYIKSLGADIVLDYRTDNLKADIEALNEDIDFYYVCAGYTDAMTAVYDAIRTDKKVYLESLEVPDISYIQPQKENVVFGFTRAFTCHGRTIVYGNGQEYPPRDGLTEKIIEWMPIAEKLVKEGKLTQPPIKIVPGGLEGVAEGMRLIKEVSNLRLVVKV